jgi:uncharacterized membrane protein YuzA (DUF378 family)
MDIATLIYILVGIIGIAIMIWRVVTYDKEHKS